MVATAHGAFGDKCLTFRMKAAGQRSPRSMSEVDKSLLWVHRDSSHVWKCSPGSVVIQPSALASVCSTAQLRCAKKHFGLLKYTQWTRELQGA